MEELLDRFPFLNIDPGFVSFRSVLGYGTNGVVFSAIIDRDVVAVKIYTHFQSGTQEARSHLKLSLCPDTMNAVVPILGVMFLNRNDQIHMEQLRALLIDVPRELTKCIVGQRTICLCMEQGIPLTKLVFKTPLEVESTCREIVQCIHLIHKKNIYHGDIKPWNFLRLYSGSARLIDFGSLCKVVNATSHVGTFHPTPDRFRAPETIVAPSQEYTAEEECWAVGCTLLYLCTGLLPNACDLPTLENFSSFFGQLKHDLRTSIAVLMKPNSELFVVRQISPDSVLDRLVGLCVVLGSAEDLVPPTNPWFPVWIHIVHAWPKRTPLAQEYMEKHHVALLLQRAIWGLLKLRPTNRATIEQVLDIFR